MIVAICGPNLNDQSKGQFHIHKNGCADLKKYGAAGSRRRNGLGGDEPYQLDAETALDVVTFVYENQIDEQPEEERGSYINDLFNDFWFAPCTDSLPTRPAHEHTHAIRDGKTVCVYCGEELEL